MTTEEKLDAILLYVADNKEKSSIDIWEIKDSVLPHESEESITTLFELIKANNAAKVNIVNDPPATWYDGQLENFLLNGTFSERKRRADKSSEHEDNKRVLSKWQRYVFWPLCILGAIGGIDTIVGWVSSPTPVTEEIREKESLPQSEENTRSTKPVETESKDSLKLKQIDS